MPGARTGEHRPGGRTFSTDAALACRRSCTYRSTPPDLRPQGALSARGWEPHNSTAEQPRHSNIEPPEKTRYAPRGGCGRTNGRGESSHRRPRRAGRRGARPPARCGAGCGVAEIATQVRAQARCRFSVAVTAYHSVAAAPSAERVDQTRPLDRRITQRSRSRAGPSITHGAAPAHDRPGSSPGREAGAAPGSWSGAGIPGPVQHLECQSKAGIR